MQGNHREHPSLADLAAGQITGLGLQTHRFGVGSEHGGGLGEVDRVHSLASVSLVDNQKQPRSWFQYT